MTSIFPTTDAPKFGAVGAAGGSLQRTLERDGRFPPINLVLRPLENAQGAIRNALQSPTIVLDRFLTYNFSSSILVPVDSFSFTFVAPDGPPLNEAIKEGDLVSLTANDVTLATGIVDATEVETQADFGEKGSLHGRDLMSQLEDQDAISFDSRPIWGNAVSVESGIRSLLDSTRITNVELRDAPSANYLLATEPGESKLAALQRFLEPLNCLAWMGPDGRMIVGKPNMAQKARGRIFLLKDKRESNVLSMRVTRASTAIPNLVVPIWAGQESTVDRVAPEQALMNAAKGPARLYKLGHRVPKAVVISTPTATDAQGLSQINAISAGGSNLLQASAKREIARKNVGEIVVEAVVPGHYDENGMPYVTDTVYHVEYDRGSVDESMYLYQVDYQLEESGGQRTNLFFCRLGAIVADVRAP